MIREPKSREGAMRQYAATYRRYSLAYAGGALFGFDWPTLRANSPETYATLKRLAALAHTLPSRRKGT